MSNFVYPTDVSSLVEYMGVSDGFNEATIPAFEAKAERDFGTIKNWILPSYRSVLDIGSGLGGVDILIAKRTKISVINIIDGDGTNNKKTSFHENTKAWFDRKLGKDLITSNVPYNAIVIDFPPDPSLTIRTDLIISLKSWGHHYPVGMYIDLVKRSLRPGGRVVMDIRWTRGNGEQVMKDNGFRWLAKTYDTIKCGRMVFERD